MYRTPPSNGPPLPPPRTSPYRDFNPRQGKVGLAGQGAWADTGGVHGSSLDKLDARPTSAIGPVHSRAEAWY